MPSWATDRGLLGFALAAMTLLLGVALAALGAVESVADYLLGSIVGALAILTIRWVYR